MKNLITITPEKTGNGKDCLKVELTIDGATKLNNLLETDTSFEWDDIYTNAGEENYSFKGNTIFTKQIIGWDAPQTVLKFVATQPIRETWAKNPAEVIIFVADPQNAERQKEVTAKLAAGMWAVYCNQKLSDALLEKNNRFQTLSNVYEKLMEGMKMLNYNNFKSDDKYYETIKGCLNDMDKEMDFCQQCVNLIKAVSKNDYYSVIPVNELYRSFRGINEQENKSKINVTHNEDEQDNDTRSNESGEITEKETERPNDPEGESPLRVV